MYVQLRTTTYYKHSETYGQLFLQKSLSQHLTARLANSDINADFLGVVSLLEITLINEASTLLPAAVLDHPLSSHLHCPSTSVFTLFARLLELSTRVYDAVHVTNVADLSYLIGAALHQIDSLEHDSQAYGELVLGDATIAPTRASRTTADDYPAFVSFPDYLEFAFTEWRIYLVIFRTILQWTRTCGASLLTPVFSKIN